MDELSAQEHEIWQKAIEHARAIRTTVANELLDRSGCGTETKPLVMFMAGAPGAGKTEVSQTVANIVNRKRIPKVLRVDPDEFRYHFPEYTGDNSHLFQMGVVKVVERVVDKLLQKRYSFILDGTFSSYIVAKRNIERAISRDYVITLTYVHQPPHVSWQFVVAREEKEGRRIHKQVFAEQYLSSIETVNRIKKEFGDQVQLDLLIRNYNQSAETNILLNQEKIDEKRLGIYTFDELMRIL